MPRQLPEYDLRYSYRKTLEASAAIALSLIILMMMVYKKFESNVQVRGIDAPPIKLEDIPITRTVKKIEVPRKPTIPIEAPEVDPADNIDLPTMDFDMLDFAPPPNAPSVEEEAPLDFFLVEVLPEVIGGPSAIQKYINDNGLFPKLAADIGVSGEVVIGFVVGADGIPRNLFVKSERPVNMGFGAAGIKAMEAQRFRPGMQRDRVVTVNMEQRISFTIK